MKYEYRSLSQDSSKVKVKVNILSVTERFEMFHHVSPTILSKYRLDLVGV
jgi:hypothetical protein